MEFDEYYARHAAALTAMHAEARAAGCATDQWVADLLHHASVLSLGFADGERRYALLEHALRAFADALRADAAPAGASPCHPGGG
jgi:hypothetical protein